MWSSFRQLRRGWKRASGHRARAVAQLGVRRVRRLPMRLEGPVDPQSRDPALVDVAIKTGPRQ